MYSTISAIICSLLLLGCATSQLSKKSKKAKHKKEEKIAGTSFYYSFSNQPATMRSYKKNVASKILSNLDSKEPTKKNLALQIQLNQISGTAYSKLLKEIKEYANIEISSSINNEISEDVKVQIALAALRFKKYGLYTQMIRVLSSSKDKDILAAVNNIKGIAALRSENVSLAASFFKSALKHNNSYLPAIINLASIYLKYANFTAARQLFAQAPGNEHYAALGHAIASRLLGEGGFTTAECGRLLRSNQQNNILVIYNCAVNAWQTNNDFKLARKLLTKVIHRKNAPKVVREKSYNLLEIMGNSSS